MGQQYFLLDHWSREFQFGEQADLKGWKVSFSGQWILLYPWMEGLTKVYWVGFEKKEFLVSTATVAPRPQAIGLAIRHR